MLDRDRNILAMQISQKNPELGAYLKTLPLDHPDLDGAKKYREDFGSIGFREYKEKIEFNKTLEEVRTKREFQRPLEKKWADEAEARKLQDDYRPKPELEYSDPTKKYQHAINHSRHPYLKTSQHQIDAAILQNRASDQAAQTGEDASATKQKSLEYEFSNHRVITPAGGYVPFLNAQERELSNTLSGTDFRSGKANVEASRANLEFTARAKAWNAHIDLAADELEKKGRFSNPDGSPKMSNYRRTRFVGGVNPDYPDALTAKEEWKLSRQLDYGHIGAASNPSWRYGINWMSNAGPEFSLYNRSESMSETIYEALAADRALRENKGLTWSHSNKKRFENIVKELADEGLPAEFNLGYFNEMPVRNMTPRDLARAEAHTLIAAGKIPEDELFMSGIEPQRMRQGMRSNIANVGQEGAGSVLLINQSMPTADTESFIAGNRRWLDKNAVKNASSPGNIIDIVRSATPEQLEKFRKDVAKAGKMLRGEGLGLTPENVTKALRGVGGASTLMLLSNIARADGEGGLEKFINGLNLMEAQTVQGDEAISNIPGVQAVKDLWGGLVNFLNENVDTVNVGPGGTYQAPVENVGDSLDAGQNVVNPYWDIAALTGSIMADQPQDVVTEQQPYYNGPGFGNYSTIPTPSIVVDEHDAKVNRGLVRNVWTSDD